MIHLEEVTNLCNLIDYQAGAIVSKTLIKKDTGTVTLFAFDEGQGLSEHTTPFEQVKAFSLKQHPPNPGIEMGS